MIYADNAATTKLDEDALKAMLPYLTNEYANASQPYTFARKAKKAMKEARETVAKCINAKPNEILFTSGGTESDNWAIKNGFSEEKNEVVTSQIEHHAILNSCSSLERLGNKTIYLPVDKDGVVDILSLKKSMNDRTRLVSIMLANNEIGTIEPIEIYSEMVHKQHILFHTDAVQAIGHIPVDVKQLGVDLLSASSHKFNGPRGVGFLYVKEGTPLEPFINGGAQESHMRAGTENLAGIVGMAVALEKNVAYMAENTSKLKKLEEIILYILNDKKITFVRNGSQYRLPGNLSLSFKGKEGEMLLHRLDIKGICVSTGSACDSQNTQISHVLKAIHLDEQFALGTIRISLGKNNTEDDAKQIAYSLVNILKK